MANIKTIQIAGGSSYNIDAYNADYASSAGNSDTVDGYHASSFLLAKTSGGIGSVSGGGQYPGCLLATIMSNSAYINNPIIFEFSGRGIPLTKLTFMFQNSSDTDPNPTIFSSNQWAQCYYLKSATYTWNIYVKYSESWGTLVLHRITGYGADRITSVNLSNTSTCPPSGATQCSYIGNVNYASHAGTVSGTTLVI